MPRFDLQGKRMKEALEAKGWRASRLADELNIPKSSVSMYLNGHHLPAQDRAVEIADLLGVSTSWILGLSDDKYSFDQKLREKTYENILPINRHFVPVLGEIACGKPRYAEELKEVQIPQGVGSPADFCVVAKGNSMINARIYDGDVVFIRKQDMVDNGDIAAVAVNDDPEVTLKRFYYYPDQTLCILRPENPEYTDMVFSGKDLQNLRVLGKAVAFQSNVR